jgi:serine/threonine-protein kinase
LTAADADQTRTVTLASPPTREGVLVGTPTYMSPEQARGETIDKRADIWALGVVMWEMLTGVRLFRGETDADTLIKVLQETPDLQDLPPETPSSVRRLLRRCLERDPNKRLHDVADARLEIEEALAPQDNALDDETNPSHPPEQRTRLQVIAASVAMGAVLATVVFATLSGNHQASPDSTLRVVLPAPSGVRINIVDWRPALAVSPDGRTVMFAGIVDGTRQLYARSLEQFDALPIPGTEGGTHPFFSPDGAWLGFFADGSLKKVAPAGGKPQVIADAPNPFGATWGPGGTIVFNPGDRRGLLEVSAAGGTPELLAPPNLDGGEWDINWPEFLPDGRSLLFTSYRGISPDNCHIEVLDLATRTRKTVVENASFARYLPTGHLIYGHGSDAHVAPFDAERHVVTGPAVPVPEAIFCDFEAGLPHLAYSMNGSLAFVASGPLPKRRLVSVDLEGRETPLFEARRGFMYPQFSPDGKRLAVTISEPGDTNIWVLDLTTQTQTKITLEGTNIFPSWSPDGQYVTFLSDRRGRITVERKRADGGGDHEPLFAPDDYTEWTSDVTWSPDGEHLVFTVLMSTMSNARGDIWAAHKDNLQDPRRIVATNAAEYGAVVSPDGHWLAYVSNESGRGEIYVQPFPDGGRRYKITTEGGIQPGWAPDGRSIYFRNNNHFLSASVSTTPVFRADAPTILFEANFAEGTFFNYPNFDISPDGKRFVMIKPDPDWGVATEINLVFNWFEELERLLPSD